MGFNSVFKGLIKGMTFSEGQTTPNIMTILT